MPKKVKELSAVEVKRIDRPGRHAVGSIPGLLLVVKDTGARSWIFRTMVGGKRRGIGLGGYPEVPLAEARERARAIKKDIRERGVDPIEQKPLSPFILPSNGRSFGRFLRGGRRSFRLSGKPAERIFAKPLFTSDAPFHPIRHRSVWETSPRLIVSGPTHCMKGPCCLFCSIPARDHVAPGNR